MEVCGSLFGGLEQTTAWEWVCSIGCVRVYYVVYVYKLYELYSVALWWEYSARMGACMVGQCDGGCMIIKLVVVP